MQDTPVSISGSFNQIFPTSFDVAYDFPYNGGYVWDNVDSKKEIIKLIKEIEKLPFVESAGPNYIEHPC